MYLKVINNKKKQLFVFNNLKFNKKKRKFKVEILNRKQYNYWFHNSISECKEIC